jgi:hypothetical protein
MSIATLVVGLGGTGIQALRSLKRLYDNLPKDERVPASFLGIDFDRSAVEVRDLDAKLAELAELEEDEFLYLEPGSIQEALRNLDRAHGEQPAWAKVLEWFPDRIKIPVSEVEANGASQMRVLGRLGFFLHDEAISRSIRRKLHELGGEVDPLRLAEDKRVILVSSIAGGTGAGMLIDIAYLVRRQLGRPKVQAYLLLPEVFQDVDSGGRIFQNAYACLQELCNLKDQQIPIQANYFHLPALDVPVHGEEPFSRLFLCPSEGFCGTEPIREATARLAESIFGQLQKTIQLRTLSIVSNLASADPLQDQGRRRSHCFSTVGSQFLQLTPVEGLDAAVFDAAVRAMNQPSFLADIYGKEIAAASRELSEILRGDEIPAASRALEEPSEKGDEDRDRANRNLIRSWRGRIERDAALAREEICNDLKKQLNLIEEKLRSRRPEEVDAAVQRLGTFVEFLLADFGDEKYERKLVSLRDLTSQESVQDSTDTGKNTLFDRLDRRLRDEIRSHVSTMEKALGDNPIERKALFKSLLDDKSLFHYPFPEKQSDEVKSLRERAQARSSNKTQRRLFVPQPKVVKVIFARKSLDDLRTALADPVLRANIEAILRVRAVKELRSTLTQRLAKIEEQLPGEKAWDKVPKEEFAGPTKIDQLASPLREKVRELLRNKLPRLIEKARGIEAEKDPEALRNRLFELVRIQLREDRELGREQQVLEWDERGVKERLRAALVRSRQRVFERRTPNVLRKGFVLIMVPEGLVWPHGRREELFKFLVASASQILDSQAQVVGYKGSRIWIYSEDLFNPPDHIRNIEDYYQAYRSSGFVELYHIDRRFLKLREFRDIRTTTSTFVAVCGNANCSYNITNLPPESRTCPGCHSPIRSRCGNAGCPELELHKHPRRYDKSCPTCQGFNHAAWWTCCEHGEIPEEIPIDKELCPHCIEEHQRDPIAFPKSRISQRPDVRQAVFCPRCVDLHAKDRRHRVFRIPAGLLCFYYDGVNGHDREKFEAIASRERLPDNVLCPNCRTLLIPVHHAVGCGCCGAEETQCPIH